MGIPKLFILLYYVIRIYPKRNNLSKNIYLFSNFAQTFN